MEFWKSASILEDHIRRFCIALEDESLGDRLSQMVFSSIDDLDRHLDSQRKNQIQHQFMNRQVDTSSSGIRRREMTRDKSPSMEYQILLAREDSDYDSRAVTNTPKEQLHHEIYALGVVLHSSYGLKQANTQDGGEERTQDGGEDNNENPRSRNHKNNASSESQAEQARVSASRHQAASNSQTSQSAQASQLAQASQVTQLHGKHKKSRRDLLTCNTSYDPPPLVPRVYFANSTTSLPEEFDLLEAEQLGYWRKSDLSDRARSYQAFLDAAINVPARILADTGANLSVIHRRMAERLNLKVDTSKRIGINGLGPNSVSTFGMMTIKLTIAGGIVFIFSLSVCDIGPVELYMILGMDFMSKDGFVIDTGNREFQPSGGKYVPLLTEGVKYETTFLSYVKLRYYGTGCWRIHDDGPPQTQRYSSQRCGILGGPFSTGVPSLCADCMASPVRTK
ncbi:hypothetical protein AaE_013122 [Aphanomyces astaci]|uniref:Peptidase A2 domain-containing protein n=1 Tax=Aphanomyces astaci TaxID=112090 RepID=A0A6A4Z8M1_APHAT|nr:hypothetical protein AaE_013122 [Aphanomyces astaci]